MVHHLRYVLRFVYFLNDQWSIVVWNFFEHYCSHEFVFVESHSLEKLVILVVFRRHLDQHTDCAAVAVAFIGCQLFKFDFVEDIVLWWSLHFFFDDWNVVWIINFESFGQPDSCWRHIFYFGVLIYVLWNCISCTVTVYPISAVRNLGLKES